MTGLPREDSLDSTVALLREGYAFIGNRCRRLETDAFETRLLGRRTVCLVGAEGARRVYDGELMQRQGAMPGWVRNVLVGRGGVQNLDGEAHRHRKRMFMELMTRDRIAALSAGVDAGWRAAAEGWRAGEPVVLFDVAQQVLCRAVCAWAGVPLPAEDVARRARQLDSMVARSTDLAWGHWQGHRARWLAERWQATLVQQVRDGTLTASSSSSSSSSPDPASALARIAAHREPAGEPLAPQVAAVEMLNLLRPTVLVATYVVFAALALHRFPETRLRLRGGDDGSLTEFVHEVRRYYPFFPFVAAVVRTPFTWRDYRFEPGRRVLLDVYGTNRDPRIWSDPEDFRPQRFAAGPQDPYTFIPQGAGDHYLHHRCAGEWITIELMKTTVRFLLDLNYRVPEQDLGYSLRRIPTLPRSGMRIVSGAERAVGSDPGVAERGVADI